MDMQVTISNTKEKQKSVLWCNSFIITKLSRFLNSYTFYSISFNHRLDVRQAEQLEGLPLASAESHICSLG